MRISILFFSGTGNTKSIAYGYSQLLKDKGHDVAVSSIETASTLDEHDLLIIGGPIYAGNMPHELIQWVRKNIPKTSSNKIALVYSTSAGLQNAHGVKSIGKKLSNKGYTIVDLLAYEMPRNFYIDKYDPTPEFLQKQQFKNAAQMIADSINNLQIDKPIEFMESVLLIDIMADLFSIMAKSLGKNFSIDESCISCGICEKNCPKNNITLKDKKYHNRCILCTRCIHNCPANAISYKKKKIEPYRVQYKIKL
ncbi:MAG: EFR1 family ferrodoxin [Clostridiales bacterium]|nr:EFR1 family ferrodoxin [Clostridiales bacterium]